MEIHAKARKALLKGGRVIAVESREGSPGGFNNDQVVLTMESGDKIFFDSYSGGNMFVNLVADRG